MCATVLQTLACYLRKVTDKMHAQQMPALHGCMPRHVSCSPCSSGKVLKEWLWLSLKFAKFGSVLEEMQSHLNEEEVQAGQVGRWSSVGVTGLSPQS